MTKADVMECAELAITPVRPEELRMGTKAAALLIVGLLGAGVHFPGEKLVPIASKKKSVEQQARKTFNKNETAAPDMPKPVPAGAPDWAGDLFQELDEQREHNFRVQAREQESRVRERKSKSLGDRLIDGLIVTSGETLLMCAVVSLIGFVWFYFKPAPTDSDD